MDGKFLDHAETQIMKTLHETRPQLLEAYGNVDEQTKADQTVVTKLDLMLEEKLRATLTSLDGSIGIEGEEYGIEGNHNTRWLVDPIDGTEQFVRGLPGCKNLMALMHEGEPVWSLMYMFTTDNLWIARKGEGLTNNGEPVKMAYRPLDRCWLEIGVDLRKQENIDRVMSVRQLISGLAINRDLIHVLEGRVDGMLSLDGEGGPWDYAPRGLMFQEAGAKVTNIGVETYDYGTNYLAAHPRNFDQMMAALVTPTFVAI